MIATVKSATLKDKDPWTETPQMEAPEYWYLVAATAMVVSSVCPRI